MLTNTAEDNFPGAPCDLSDQEDGAKVQGSMEEIVKETSAAFWSPAKTTDNGGSPAELRNHLVCCSTSRNGFFRNGVRLSTCVVTGHQNAWR